MKKSAIDPLPKYFDRYINLIEDIEIDEAFQNSLDEIAQFDWKTCEKLGFQAYAPGKWAVHDVLQHLIDWERIMAYRALVFARGVVKKAQGLDENLMAENALSTARSIPDLVEEMVALRQSTRLFFKKMNEGQLQKSGICWQSNMSALALGFTILGHQRHHLGILQERYLPLV